MDESFSELKREALMEAIKAHPPTYQQARKGGLVKRSRRELVHFLHPVRNEPAVQEAIQKLTPAPVAKKRKTYAEEVTKYENELKEGEIYFTNARYEGAMIHQMGYSVQFWRLTRLRVNPDRTSISARLEPLPYVMKSIHSSMDCSIYEYRPWQEEDGDETKVQPERKKPLTIRNWKLNWLDPYRPDHPPRETYYSD